MHEMMLAHHGGLSGVRDEGLLASALDRPKNLFVYESPGIPQLAAILASGIVLNHPFIDGNKRTGFLVSIVFLELNGFSFNATEESVVEQTLALAARELDENDYASWIAAHSIAQ